MEYASIYGDFIPGVTAARIATCAAQGPVTALHAPMGKSGKRKLIVLI